MATGGLAADADVLAGQVQFAPVCVRSRPELGAVALEPDICDGLPPGMSKIEFRAAPSVHRWRDPLALFGFAFLLRALGVNYGGTSSDEYLGQAVRILGGELFPKDLFYPQLTNYVSAAAVAVLYGLGRLLGFVRTSEHFQDMYFRDPMPFYVAARLAHGAVSALLAPIAYGAGRRLGLDRGHAAALGALAAVAPVAVWFAHWAKPQNGLTLGIAGASLLGLLYLEEGRRRWAVGFGFFVGLGVAFMHSGVFPAASLGAGIVCGALFRDRRAWPTVARDAGAALLTAVAVWALLSIPILVRFSDFLAFQVIQSQLSVREGGFEPLVHHALPMLASWTRGLSPVGLLLAPVALALTPRSSVRWLLAPLLAGMLSLAWVVGDRPPARLFMPFTVSIVLLTGYALLDAGARSDPSARWGLSGRGWGRALAAALLIAGVGGTAEVVRQAIAVPGGYRVAALLEARETPDTRIMIPDIGSIRLAQNRAVQDELYERHLRLGQKYGVEVPPRNLRKLAVSSQGGLHVREYPWVLGGLEFTRPEDVKEVRPFHWPAQYEEWTVDHWLDRGYSMFVVWDTHKFLKPGVAPDYMFDFFTDLVARCEQFDRVEAHRDLFFEEQYLLLDRCRRN